jgi:predicted secreted hydrolase
MVKRFLTLTLLSSLVITAFWWVTQRPTASAPPALALASDSDLTGFARAYEAREFEFPLDHGPHEDYQTEWWYYTGNLTAASGEHFGYQLTFFRRGLTPGAPPLDASLTTNQIYFAHFAISDVAGGQHTFAERFSRGAGGLAGGSGEPFRVWLEDWSTESLNAEGSLVRLYAKEGEMALDLTLRPTKPIARHGDQGLSPKSETPGNASYYLSYTRMATEGQLTVRGQALVVQGESWFDHEWSTSALGEGAVGWDWFSLQLGDGRELMLFQIRRQDGGLEPVSGGTLVEPDGRTLRLAMSDVQIEVLSRWRSPKTNAEYPARWRITIPAAQVELDAEPWLAEQEMRVTGTYWEGAVRFTGTSQGAAVAGNGYIELTGYAASLEDTF